VRAASAASTDNALLINHVEIKCNPGNNALEVKMPSAMTTEFLERKRTVYHAGGGTQIYQNSSGGASYTLSESVNTGDILEFEYQLNNSTRQRDYYRVYIAGGTVNLIGFAGGQTKASGFSAYSFSFTFSGSSMLFNGGYLLLNWANGGGSLLENGMMTLFRIDKILRSGT
jgi:hypothetical protein